MDAAAPPLSPTPSPIHPPTPKPGTTVLPGPAIRARGLYKRYGRKIALAGMDFSVPMGSVAGFLGPNGAGKTTALRLLLGLVPADAGEMELLGNAMPGQRSRVLEQTGAMVEAPCFIESMSGTDNLSWFGSLNKPVSSARIAELLDLVGLTEAAGRPFGNYSTGMKQRLGVAFTLLHQPQLLILDEPTNGMDPQGRAQMRDLFKNIHQRFNTTIFLSSHLIDEIQRLCDFVVIVDQGKTVRQGFVAELLAGDRERWEVRIPDTETAKAREVLSKLPTVFSCTPAPRGLELLLRPDGSAQVNRTLHEAGLTVTALIPHEASLEDTFLRLTDGGDHR